MSLSPAVRVSRSLHCTRSLTQRKILLVRPLVTLAIETSCDDTSVSILETHDHVPLPSVQEPFPTSPATLHFLKNITSDSRKYQGIHPLVALDSHEDNLAKLIDDALWYLPQARDARKNDYGNGNDDGSIISLRSASSSDTSPFGASATGRARTASVTRRKPDFITVTRGPGMRANLQAGLNVAKGLAVAWQIPLVGVHHMQAHLLTPRLVSALRRSEIQVPSSPPAIVGNVVSACAATENTDMEFPSLSLLVSGGHTLLVYSTSPLDHRILADTVDTAVGDALDKISRLVLPASYLEQSTTTMYGKMLESFAFPNGMSDYSDYVAPATREAETTALQNPKWGWSFTPPYTQSRSMSFAFSGIISSVQSYISAKEAAGNSQATDRPGQPEAVDDFLPSEARVLLARDSMRLCFEHLASRVIIGLEALWRQAHAHEDSLKRVSTTRKPGKQASIARKLRMGQIKGATELPKTGAVKSLVVSGGVASNRFLRAVLRSFLDVRGFNDVKIVAPPPQLCTDNAAMIGWTGLEMFQAGWTSDLGIRALRRWALDPTAEDGGILGANGWVNKAGKAETLSDERAAIVASATQGNAQAEAQQSHDVNVSNV